MDWFERSFAATGGYIVSQRSAQRDGSVERIAEAAAAGSRRPFGVRSAAKTSRSGARSSVTG
jgi:hypothetical protein